MSRRRGRNDSLAEVKGDHVRLRDRKRTGTPDAFQTPPHALDPLWQYLNPKWIIWECACGKGNLVRAFWEREYGCVGTDITHGKDFLRDPSPEQFDAIITNPPFSLKNEFIARCYEYGKPFALLLPLTTLATNKRQRMFDRGDIQVLLMPHRIDFETPNNKGKRGGAWFDVAWFCHGLNLPSQLTFWQPDWMVEKHLEQHQLFQLATVETLSPVSPRLQDNTNEEAA